MANKKLRYPAEEIDEKLGVAHTHNNKDALDQITATDADNIKDIENKADKNLRNVIPDDFRAKAEEAGVAFEDVADNDRIYGRQNGAWVDITSRSVNPEITSDTLNVTTANNVTDIELPSTTVDAINSIEDKVDKVTMPIGNIVSSSGSGNLQDSGIATTDVVRKSELADDVTMDDPDIAPSTALTHDLYELISGVSGGIGQTRGSVYHAFNNSGTTDVYTISTVSVDTANAGTGYIEGSLLGYSGVIDASFIINEVDDGASGNNKVVSVSLENGGMFESDIPSNITPYGGGESATGLHLNVTTITTARTTLNDIENPVKGDTAYVMQDELHNDSRSIWMYTELESGAFGWTWLTSFAPESRNFITNPIQTNEIQDEAVTYDKLESIPSNTVLANVSTSEASPQPVSTDELFSKLDVVTGVKGQAESDYRSGEVSLSPQDIGWSRDNILVNPNYLKTSTSGSDITIDLSDDVIAQLEAGGISINEQYFINEAYQDSTRLSLAKSGIKIIADSGIFTDSSTGTEYPSSLTPPSSANDVRVATTEFTQNAIINAILPISAQISAINSKLDLESGTEDGATLPYLTAGTYNIQLYAGTWTFECWGAQGGGQYGGLGGYAKTTVVVTDKVTIYVVVGSQPGNSNGGFNGGGSSASYSGLGGNCIGYGGGGATHVALVDGTLSNIESQKDKVLVVAGGGGGSYVGTDTTGNVMADDDAAYSIHTNNEGYGYGGGLEGGKGYQYSSGAHAGEGGTQTARGERGLPYNPSYDPNDPEDQQKIETGESMYNPTSGTFGKGGNGNTTSAPGYSPNHGGAGGGGWYGGGGATPYYSSHSGYHTKKCYAAGGGGSGYINVFSNSQDLEPAGENIFVKLNDNKTLTTALYNSSGEISITDANKRCVILNGNQSYGSYLGMPNADKNAEERWVRGHAGNGMAKITYISKDTN